MRRLEYVKNEHLVVDILKHVQALTVGKLLTQDGAPNVTVIKRYFLFNIYIYIIRYLPTLFNYFEHMMSQ